MSAIETSPVTPSPQTQRASKKIQLELLIREFQSKLGPKWDTYHEALTLFLIGKLSRAELVETVSPLLKNGLFKLHNKFLLLNFANSLQDSPAEFCSDIATFWNKKNAKAKNVKSTQYEKFKQNIMGLPLKERRRIRSITRDSGKRNKINAYLTLTRQALLPKIPFILDREKQLLQVNNLVQWQQDVVTGINTPLSLTSYELPDLEGLSRQVLMTMRENGLTGGLNSRVLDVITLGLEIHLKNILESAIDTVRYREKKYGTSSVLLTFQNLDGDFDLKNALALNGTSPQKKRKISEEKDKKPSIVISSEDLYNTFEMFPHLIEPCGPKFRLSNNLLQNDDMVDYDSWGYTLPPKPASLLVPTIKSPFINGTKAEEKSNKETKEGEQEKELDNGEAKLQAVVKAQTSAEINNFGTVDELKWVLHDLITSL